MVELRITVGRFALALGGPDGTRADPAPRPAPDRRKKLARAHRARRQEVVATAATAVASAADEAEQVTAAIERANGIVRTLASGLTLDPKTISRQADLLLGLWERADREGRFEDERRLARALVALLALVSRWLALLEVLRRVASAAAAVGDRAAEAWAHHELGTFALAADDAPLAADHLERALSLRDALGDREDAETSRHNLELVSFIPEPSGLRARLARRPVLVAGAVVLALLLGGGLAAAIVARDGDDTNGTAPNASTTITDTGTESETGGTQTGTTDEQDTVAPTVVLEPLPPFVRGIVEVEATATDGDSGVASVAFSALSARGETALDEDTEEPYAVEWDTTGVDDGEYTVEAVAVDVAGNRSDPGSSGTVVDNSPPTVSVGDTQQADGGVTLTANAEDAGSGVDQVVFDVAPEPIEGEPNWEPVGDGVPADAPAYELAIDVSKYSSGTYLYRAHAFDRVGNTGASGNVGRFVVPTD